MKNSKFRLAGWLAVGGLLGAALLTPTAALATQPAPEHKVTICHRTDSDTNPYNIITVDIASSGHLQGGHDTEHEGPIWDPTLKDQKIEWGDIIPPYTYGDFSYPGQNWEDGAAILRADCVIETETDDPSAPVETESAPVETESAPVETESAPVETESAPVETESAPVETESAPVETESAPVETESAPVETESAPVETESAPVETEPTCQDEQGSDECETPVGSVDAETGTPNEDVTPPSTDTLTPTNTPSSDGWQLVLLALAALLSTALILTPASRKARRR